ncbi:MAG: ribosome maturation factor RimP [Candidimonas sp.]|nr:MAG: ribosome maturation factor RimP [Candidimonas sp.]
MTDIVALARQTLAGTDLELVDVERAPLGLLRVTIDRPEGVRIEDCERVSRQLSRVFDVENIDYKRLEVGSPGLDRALKTETDFLRFAGRRAEVKLRQAVDGRRVFVGLLHAPACDGAPDGARAAPVFGLELEAEGGPARALRFTFADVERARLDPVLDFKGKRR